MAVTAELHAKFTAKQTAALDLGGASANIAIDKILQFTDGTTANKADIQFSDRRTLAASATEDLDLAGVLLNPFGGTITAVEVVAIYVGAATANVNSVIIGDATTPVALFGGANATFSVKPGGFFYVAAPDASGLFTVGAGTTDDIKLTNSSGTTGVTFDIAILARSI